MPAHDITAEIRVLKSTICHYIDNATIKVKQCVMHHEVSLME